MNETKLTTILQIEQFLAAMPEIEFTSISDARDVERYAHISRALKHFDYLRRTTAYSRAQHTRLVPPIEQHSFCKSWF